MTAENDLDVSGATAEGSVTLVSRLGDMVAELIGSGGDMKIDAAGNLTAGNINAGEKSALPPIRQTWTRLFPAVTCGLPSTVTTFSAV